MPHTPHIIISLPELAKLFSWLGAHEEQMTSMNATLSMAYEKHTNYNKLNIMEQIESHFNQVPYEIHSIEFCPDTLQMLPELFRSLAQLYDELLPLLNLQPAPFYMDQLNADKS